MRAVVTTILLFAIRLAVAAVVEISVHEYTGVPIKPVNGVGQPPMVGALGDWRMFHYLKDAGIPYSRLHDVGGLLGGGLYVDIPNVFPDFDADENDPHSYRFACTDSLMKALEQNDVEPFFRLGVTIENFVERGLPRIRTVPPADFAKWGRVCEHVIRHYTEGWANGFVMKVSYWEIWNEPDNMPETSANPMWGGAFDEFMQLYGTVAPYLKSKFPGLKIGGYGSCGFYAAVDSAVLKSANSSPRTEYFVDCARRFLMEARDKGWPLDFFSYHSYSEPTEAMRQVEYADSLLTQFGFHRERTERVFNEWLPLAGLENSGTARQAAAIAAELILLQNAPCDLACIYDARCATGAYSPLFNPLDQKPHKAYYAFMAFNELRKCGRAVKCEVTDNAICAVAASNGGRFAFMVANPTGSIMPFTAMGIPAASECILTDEIRTYEKVAMPTALPEHSFLLVTGSVE